MELQCVDPKGEPTLEGENNKVEKGA